MGNTQPLAKFGYAIGKMSFLFLGYPPEIRQVIYTTNAIESLNMTLRKFIKNKRVFPSDEAAFKQIYLAMQIIAKKWTMPIRDWKPALARFTIEFGDRI